MLILTQQIIKNNKIKTPIKRIQYLLDIINLLHHCITDKDWYIDIQIYIGTFMQLYTKKGIKYRYKNYICSYGIKLTYMCIYLMCEDQIPS